MEQYKKSMSALEIMKDMSDEFDRMTNEFEEVQLIKEPLQEGLLKLDNWDKIFSDTSGKIEEKYTSRLNEVNSQLDTKVNKKTLKMYYHINDFDGNNDSEKIENAISTMPIGATLVFDGGVSYTVKDIIINKPLIFQGNGCIFLNDSDFTTLHNPTIWINASNVEIDNIKFSYVGWDDNNFNSLNTTRPNGSSYYGNHICASFPELFNKESSGIYGSFRGNKLKELHNIIIKNCHIHGSALHGISLFNSENCIIENCKLEQIKGTGIFGFFTKGLKIYKTIVNTSYDDSIFITCNKDYYGVWNNYEEKDMIKVTISDCELIKSSTKAIGVTGYEGVVIESNYIDNTWCEAIWTTIENSIPSKESKNVIITNNIFKNIFACFGEKTEGFSKQNKASGAITAFNLGRSDNTVFSNNNISFADVNLRMMIIDSNNVDISGNTFLNCKNSLVIGSETNISTRCNNVNVVNNYFEITRTFNVILLAQGSKNTFIANNKFYTEMPITSNVYMIMRWNDEYSLIKDNYFDCNNGYNILGNQGSTMLSKSLNNYKKVNNEISFF